MKLYLSILVATVATFFAYGHAAAQTPTATPGGTCETVLFDWSSSTDLQGWAYYTQEGTVQPLTVVSNALQGEQSGAGLSGYRAASDVSHTIQAGDVFKVTSELGGGQISGGIYLQYNDVAPDTVLAGSTAVVAGGTMNPYGLTTHSVDLTSKAGDELTSVIWVNRDAQTGSRTYRIYRAWIEYPCSPTPTPTPGGGELCPLVPYGFFSDVGDWSLSGTAAISGSVLSLASGDSATQNLSTLESNTFYTAVISVTSVVASADVAVSIAFDTETINVTETGEFSTTLQTGSLAGPVAFTVENTPGSSPIELDYVCLYISDDQGGNENRVCIAPDNGEFDTAADWGFYRGASHNAGAQDAKLPFNEGGDKALIQATSFYTFPTLAVGEYLIASFDARANGESATVANRIGYTFASSHVSEFVAFQEVYNQTYTFEFDISFLAEEDQNSVSFANPGAEGSENDLYVDNVCIFVSTQPPQLPSPSDPNAPPTVDLGEFYGCGDVDGILYGLIGVDLRYHRAVYAETPGFLDFSDWVPWLVAAFWMGVNVYLCVVMVLIQTFINFVEYVTNNRINILTWVLNSSLNFIDWLGLWLTNNVVTFENAVEAGLETAENWLEWAALIALAFSVFPVSFFALLFVAMLWVFGGFFYLGEFLENYFPWLSAQLTNVERDLFNRFVTLWNLFLANLGPALSEMVSAFIEIWNHGVVPFLLGLGPLYGLIGLIIQAIISFPAIWNFVWAVTMWLWENVFQVISMPISFYIGLQDGMQSNAFGSLLDCTAPGDFWCAYLAGVDLSNSVAGATVFYPVVIVGIIIGTLYILKRHGGAGWERIIESIENF